MDQEKLVAGPPDVDSTPDTISADLSEGVTNIKISDDDPILKLKSWLGKALKFVITDDRVIVGLFVCTDRDGNVILENSWVCSETIVGDDEWKFLGLALIPGKHIKTVARMTS